MTEPTEARGSSVLSEDRPELRALGCIRCGGSLTLRERAALARCDYCGTSFISGAPDGTFPLAATARIDAAEAEKVVRGLLRNPRCPSDLAVRSSRVSCELLYAPFWRFSATFVARVRGRREIVERRLTRQLASEGETSYASYRIEKVAVGEEEVDEEIQQIWRGTVSAAPLEDLGIPRLTARRQMPGGLSRLAPGASDLPDLVLLDALPEDAVRIDPMVRAADARAEGELLFGRFVETRGAELRGRELVHERLQSRSALLYYPVYRVRYQYRSRIYEATVDGLDGRPVRATIPLGRHGRLLPLLVTAGLGGFLGGSLIRALLFPPALLPELGAWPAHPSFWLVGGTGVLAFVLAMRALIAGFGREEDDAIVTSW